MQAGLLQLLEEGSFRRLGEAGSGQKAGARFIVGTNQDLARSVREGRFREDLYYRINVLPMRLPGLDERRDEIEAWVEFMLERAAGQGQRLSISLEGLGILRERSWPGNLRQLDNVVRRSLIMARVRAADMIGAQDVQAALLLEQSGPHPQGAHDPCEAMRRAAASLVEAAVRARARGGCLDLEMTDALRGYVLEQAQRRFDDVDRALELFGKSAAIENRNQHRILRRERARMHALEDLFSTLYP